MSSIFIVELFHLPFNLEHTVFHIWKNHLFFIRDNPCQRWHWWFQNCPINNHFYKQHWNTLQHSTFVEQTLFHSIKAMYGCE